MLERKLLFKRRKLAAQGICKVSGTIIISLIKLNEVKTRFKHKTQLTWNRVKVDTIDVKIPQDQDL